MGIPTHIPACTAFDFSAGRIYLKLTSMSPTSKGVFSAKYRLSNEQILAMICKLLDWSVKAMVTVYMYMLEQTDWTVQDGSHAKRVDVQSGKVWCGCGWEESVGWGKSVGGGRVGMGGECKGKAISVIYRPENHGSLGLSTGYAHCPAALSAFCSLLTLRVVL